MLFPQKFDCFLYLRHDVHCALNICISNMPNVRMHLCMALLYHMISSLWCTIRHENMPP